MTNPKGIPVSPSVPPPTPPLLQAQKPDVAKSEFWIVVAGMVGSLLSALTATKPGVGPWVSAGTMVATAVIYALIRTPLLAEKPGWKTKAFWSSLIVVVMSGAVAIAETDIPGLPPGVTKTAAVLVTMLAALGYTAIRSSDKRTVARSKKTK